MPVSELGQHLLHQIDRVWPAESLDGVTSILAVSGGPDSVALARLVAERPVTSRVFVAHFDHGLRAQSSEDSAFVERLSDQLGFEFVGGRAGDLAIDSNQGQGLEAKARSARYEFLKTTAKDVGARFVVTAHTMDDQAETLIHRFFRGTGIRGLKGIAQTRILLPGISLVRPLIQCRKKDVLAYLQLIRQGFQVDQSNSSKQFTRNRIRNELLPLVMEILGQDPIPGLSSLAELATHAQSWVDLTVDALYESHIGREGESIWIRANQNLLSQPRFLINELLAKIWRDQGWPQQQMTSNKWNSLSDLILGSQSDPTVTGDVSPTPTVEEYTRSPKTKMSDHSGTQHRPGPSAKIVLPGRIIAERRMAGIVIWDDSGKSD